MFNTIDPNDLVKKDIYKLFTHAVVPRPIAFVTSLSKENVLNAAPFSYFNVHGTKPSILSVTVGKRDGVDKDTARNIKENKAFVVHITTEDYIEKVNQTSKPHHKDESEVAIYNFTPIKSDTIKVDGVKEFPIRFECELYDVMPLKHEGIITSEIFFGEVKKIHLAKHLGDRLDVPIEKIKPIARLGGKNYAPLGKSFALKRPK